MRWSQLCSWLEGLSLLLLHTLWWSPRHSHPAVVLRCPQRGAPGAALPWGTCLMEVPPLPAVLCQTFIKMGLLSSFTCSDEFSSLRLHHNRAITHLMRSARETVRQVSPENARGMHDQCLCSPRGLRFRKLYETLNMQGFVEWWFVCLSPVCGCRVKPQVDWTKTLSPGAWVLMRGSNQSIEYAGGARWRY